MRILVLIAGLGLAACSLIQKQEPSTSHMTGWSVTCEASKVVSAAKVCVYKKGAPKRTILALHGAGCKEDWLQNPGVCIPPKEGDSEKEMMQKLTDVAIIAPSFGPIWMADTAHPKQKGSADPEATVKNVLAIMDESIADHALPSKLSLFGHSMGGFNAAQILLTSDRFSKAVLVHPMIPDCDLFSKEILNEDCLPDMMLNPGLGLDPQFTEKHWKEINPLTVSKTKAITTNTLVLVCWKDDFDLVSGPKQFANQAMKLGPVFLLETTADCDHYGYDDVDSVLGALQ